MKVLVIAYALGLMGMLSGFMVGILHGVAGDWIPMVIFVVMCLFGYMVLRSPIKQLIKLLRRK